MAPVVSCGPLHIFETLSAPRCTCGGMTFKEAATHNAQQPDLVQQFEALRQRCQEAYVPAPPEPSAINTPVGHTAHFEGFEAAPEDEYAATERDYREHVRANEAREARRLMGCE